MERTDENFFLFMEYWCCDLENVPESAHMSVAAEGVYDWNRQTGDTRSRHEWAKKYLARFHSAQAPKKGSAHADVDGGPQDPVRQAPAGRTRRDP